MSVSCPGPDNASSSESLLCSTLSQFPTRTPIRRTSFAASNSGGQIRTEQTRIGTESRKRFLSVPRENTGWLILFTFRLSQREPIIRAARTSIGRNPAFLLADACGDWRYKRIQPEKRPSHPQSCKLPRYGVRSREADFGGVRGCISASRTWLGK